MTLDEAMAVSPERDSHWSYWMRLWKHWPSSTLEKHESSNCASSAG